MSVFSGTTLFIVMALVAALPSSSTAVVVARSLAGGRKHGIAAAFGIVLGDLVFVALVLFGLVAAATAMGQLFTVIKYLGAIYLIWLGVSLIRSKRHNSPQGLGTRPENTVVSFAAGFLLTLGDLKAILFYVSFFPTVFDVQRFTAADIASVFLITFVSVGGVKTLYALLAAYFSSKFDNSNDVRPVQVTAGSVMVGTGVYLMVKQ